MIEINKEVIEDIDQIGKYLREGMFELAKSRMAILQARILPSRPKHEAKRLFCDSGQNTGMTYNIICDCDASFLGKSHEVINDYLKHAIAARAEMQEWKRLKDA